MPSSPEITPRTRIRISSKFERDSAPSALAAIQAAKVKCLAAGQQLVRAYFDLALAGEAPTADMLIAQAERHYTPPRAQQDRARFWRDYLLTNLRRGIFEIDHGDSPRAAPSRAEAIVTASRTLIPPAGDEQPPAVDATWIDLLLSAPRFAEQAKALVRPALSPERVREFLIALTEQGNKLTTTTLANSLGLSLPRTMGVVAAVQRLLNVDAYPILEHDEASATVTLNRELLRRQFGV